MHFKLEVIRYLAEKGNENGYYFLIDNDILCLNEMPENLFRCVRSGIPVYYDLTSQRYPAYGRERIISDKELLMVGELSLGMWVGGEFLGGGAGFFRQLSAEISPLVDRYFSCYKQLHHQGDEVLLSVAVERLLRKGVFICEVGKFGVISRFWSVPTLHVQNKWKSVADHFMVHLPADKWFFQHIKRLDADLPKLLQRYLFWKMLTSRVKNRIVKFISLLLSCLTRNMH